MAVPTPPPPPPAMATSTLLVPELYTKVLPVPTKLMVVIAAPALIT